MEKINNELIKKVLKFCASYQKEAKEKLNVILHDDDFVIYIDGEYKAQFFYSELGGAA